MTEFYFPKRFDETEAENGVWFEIYSEAGDHYGDFHASMFSPDSKPFKVAADRWLRANKNKRKDVDAHVFVDLCLLDWKLKDAKGKAIPFDKKTALAYFTSEGGAFVLRRLVELSSDVLNYQGDPVAEQEEVLKN